MRLDYFDEVGKPTFRNPASCMAKPARWRFGKVFVFGPTFRAERSKTKRHLNEFWMVEPEVAFMDLEGDMELAEEFIHYLIDRVLEERM